VPEPRVDAYSASSAALRIERDCSDRNLWDRYVQTRPAAVNYHRYGWRDVVENTFRHRCYYLAARAGDGSIVGILPLVFMHSRLFGRFLVSVPFLNYGGLLCSSREAGDALLAEAAILLQELHAEYAELRHSEPWPSELPVKQHKVCMLLELATNAESQWQAFNPKLRNQIRKAEKNGLTAVIGGKELLADFYTVFARNMRDLGTPVYSDQLFASVLQSFPAESCIIAVYCADKPVAAGMLCWFRDTVEIPWASANRDYNHLCPNNLLYWTALQFALEKGFKRFDFGRSTPGEGTYKFKEQWGAKPLQLNWQYLLPAGASLPELNTKNPKYEMAIKLWQKLPLPVTRLLGPYIVKNIP
jgi:FemAB-related protein (PEP-CTERM system-associated)